MNFQGRASENWAKEQPGRTAAARGMCAWQLGGTCSWSWQVPSRYTHARVRFDNHISRHNDAHVDTSRSVCVKTNVNISLHEKTSQNY